MRDSRRSGRTEGPPLEGDIDVYFTAWQFEVACGSFVQEDAGAMRNVGIYIFDEVEVLDFAGPFEVFSTAARVSRRLSPGHGRPFKCSPSHNIAPQSSPEAA